MEKPGQRLKEAREQKSLSTDLIAQRLRLETRIVEAIEQDNYDVFPAVAYARGFLRNYAKEVGLDPDDIISNFNEIAADGPVLEPHVTQAQPQAKSNDKHIKVVTYSIAVASLLLLALWWHSEKEGVDERVELSQVEQTIQSTDQMVISEGEHTLSLDSVTEISESTLASSTQMSVPTDPQSVQHDFGVVYLNEAPQLSEVVDPLNLDIAESEAAAFSNQTELTQNSLSGIQTPPSAVGMTNELPSEPLEAASSASLEAELARDAIKIDLNSESWVEVRDGTSSVLYSGLAQTGEQISVSGVMPYKIVIGRASSAQFLYLGDVIDLEPLTRGQVARFVIDESGAHR